MESGVSGYESRTRERKWRSRFGLVNYLTLREKLHSKVDLLVQREMGPEFRLLDDVVLREESVTGMIDDAAEKISKELLQAIGQKEDVTRETVQGRKDDVIGFDLEVFQLCETICKQLGDLLSLIPTSTKEEEQRLIPILESMCRNTMSFCASHGQPVTELEEGQADPQLGSDNSIEEGQAEAVVAGGKFSMETGEHQRSPTVDVEAKSATKTNLSDDTEDLARDKSDAEYEEEAFARYRRRWERFYGDSNMFEDLSK
jgi:hypothetical protein